MLTKSSRLSLIRARHAALVGVSISSLLPVSKAEIRESVRSEVAPELIALDRAEIKEDDGTFASQLPFESIPKVRGEDEGGILLSAKEKRRLVFEVDAFRAESRRPFALMLVG